MSDSYWSETRKYLGDVWEDLIHNLKRGGVVLCGLLVVWLLSGVLLCAFESDKECSDIKTIGDGLYSAWITMTTVGYGDFKPLSIPGKIIACLDGFFGIIFIGVIIWLVTTSLAQPRRIPPKTTK